jgi:hypothetical protein
MPRIFHSITRPNHSGKEISCLSVLFFLTQQPLGRSTPAILQPYDAITRPRSVHVREHISVRFSRTPTRCCQNNNWDNVSGLLILGPLVAAGRCSSERSSEQSGRAAEAAVAVAAARPSSEQAAANARIMRPPGSPGSYRVRVRRTIASGCLLR